MGAPIRVGWTHAPGEGLDWIGLFRCRHGKCAPNSGYLEYDYTHTQIEGRLTIDQTDAMDAGSAPWPLRPGTYVARLLIDDSYISIAQSPRFRILAVR